MMTIFTPFVSVKTEAAPAAQSRAQILELVATLILCLLVQGFLTLGWLRLDLFLADGRYLPVALIAGLNVLVIVLLVQTIVQFRKPQL